MKKVLAATILLAAFGTSANAQTTASQSATAAATILQPLIIAKTSGIDMNFGTIIPTASPTTVILATNNTLSGTATTSTVGAGAQAGSYDITGTANAGFTITIPASDVLVKGGVPTSGADMIMNAFVSSLGASSSLSSSGTSTLLLGATLNVNANQKPGLYTSDPFNVTIAYN